MSVSNSTYPGEICQSLIQGIEEIANSMTTKRTMVGGVEGLIDPYNRQGGNVQFEQSNGHVNKVDVRYYQRAAGNASASLNTTTCTSTNEFGEKSDTFDIAQCTATDFTFTEDYVAHLCSGGNGEHFRKLIGLQWEDFTRKMNNDVLGTLAANFGKNIATGSAAQVTHDILDSTNNDQIDAAAWGAFMDELKNGNQMASAPVVIAGSTFWKFNMFRDAACCNDYGQDVGALIAQNGYAYFNDQQIDSVLGTDEAIVLEPGSTHFVPWLKYRNQVDNAVLSGDAFGAYTISDGRGRGIVRDPFTGLPVNFKVFYDDCLEKYTVQLFLQWDIWTTPTDLYASGDHMNLYNGVLDYKFT